MYKKKENENFIEYTQLQIEKLEEGASKEQAKNLLEAHQKSIKKLKRLKNSLNRKIEGSKGFEYNKRKINYLESKLSVHRKELKNILRNNGIEI